MKTTLHMDNCSSNPGMFPEALERAVTENGRLAETENGATGLSTTGKDLVDLNFKVPSFRNGVPVKDLVKFSRAYSEDPVRTVKWLFFLRDAREGLGERRAFLDFFGQLWRTDRGVAGKSLELTAGYGRWKDLVELASGAGDRELRDLCLKVLGRQLVEDVRSCMEGKGVSLLAKWLPSVNASGKSRGTALMIARELGLSNMEYRKTLSKLRGRIGVVERLTCSGRWSEVDYSKVPSKANLLYSNSFLKHDGERRRVFLDRVLNNTGGEAPKMNASVLYPYEIWNRYVGKDGGYDFYSGRHNPITYDESLEALWMNLKDMECSGNVLCVTDGSGSMTVNVGGSGVTALDIARSISVYFSERLKGPYRDKCIEFSSNPRWIDMTGCGTLMDRIGVMEQYNDCSNTDIEKVFGLILQAAVDNGLKQEELPERVLIVSDMEFDGATTLNRWNGSFQSNMKTLFRNISDMFSEAGYRMPKLVFWNVNSRTNTIPMTENGAGVILVSGFSVNLVRMVMSGKTDPWEVLKETLDSERYSAVDGIFVK